MCMVVMDTLMRYDVTVIIFLSMRADRIIRQSEIAPLCLPSLGPLVRFQRSVPNTMRLALACSGL
jgi:hypothetical protein